MKNHSPIQYRKYFILYVKIKSIYDRIFDYMKKFWQRTWIYKTYSLIRDLSIYRKDKSAIKDTFYSPEFKIILNKYLNLDVRKDWVGRLYGVINPLINENGFFDITNTIIEIDGDNTNSNVYVQNWVYKQLELIKELFHLNNLYDYIDVEIEHVGPMNADNYLLVFDIASRQTLEKSFKKWINTTSLYLLIAAIVVCGIFFIFI